MDDEGYIFVDGAGDLFRYILTYLRHGVVIPPDSESDKQRLLYEVKYFALDGMLSELVGSADVSFPYLANLPEKWQRMKVDEDLYRDYFVKNRGMIELDEPYLLLRKVPEQKITFAHTSRVPRLFPGVENKAGDPAAVATQEEFLSHWNSFTQHVFPQDWDWSNIVCAGGAVLACIHPLVSLRNDPIAQKKYFSSDSPWKSSDIDLFLYGLDSVEAASAKVNSILALFQHHFFVRTEHCVTIIPFAKGGRRIQIIFRLYKSPAEVLMGFDLDCCCVCFDGNHTWGLPRAFRALKHRMNVIDPSRQSKSYINRLVKYVKRGFSVGVPGMDRNCINPNVYTMPINGLTGVSKLIALEHLFATGKSDFPAFDSSLTLKRERKCNWKLLV
jgi:hypothetical protein